MEPPRTPKTITKSREGKSPSKRITRRDAQTDKDVLEWLKTFPAICVKLLRSINVRIADRSSINDCSLINDRMIEAFTTCLRDWKEEDASQNSGLIATKASVGDIENLFKTMLAICPDDNEYILQDPSLCPTVQLWYKNTTQEAQSMECLIQDLQNLQNQVDKLQQLNSEQEAIIYDQESENKIRSQENELLLRQIESLRESIDKLKSVAPAREKSFAELDQSQFKNLVYMEGEVKRLGKEIRELREGKEYLEHQVEDKQQRILEYEANSIKFQAQINAEQQLAKKLEADSRTKIERLLAQINHLQEEYQGQQATAVGQIEDLQNELQDKHEKQLIATPTQSTMHPMRSELSATCLNEDSPMSDDNDVVATSMPSDACDNLHLGDLENSSMSEEGIAGTPDHTTTMFTTDVPSTSEKLASVSSMGCAASVIAIEENISAEHASIGCHSESKNAAGITEQEPTTDVLMDDASDEENLEEMQGVEDYPITPPRLDIGPHLMCKPSKEAVVPSDTDCDNNSPNDAKQDTKYTAVQETAVTLRCSSPENIEFPSLTRPVLDADGSTMETASPTPIPNVTCHIPVEETTPCESLAIENCDTNGQSSVVEQPGENSLSESAGRSKSSLDEGLGSLDRDNSSDTVVTRSISPDPQYFANLINMGSIRQNGTTTACQGGEELISSMRCDGSDDSGSSNVHLSPMAPNDDADGAEATQITLIRLDPQSTAHVTNMNKFGRKLLPGVDINTSEKLIPSLRNPSNKKPEPALVDNQEITAHKLKKKKAREPMAQRPRRRRGIKVKTKTRWIQDDYTEQILKSLDREDNEDSGLSRSETDAIRTIPVEFYRESDESNRGNYRYKVPNKREAIVSLQRLRELVALRNEILESVPSVAELKKDKAIRSCLGSIHETLNSSAACPSIVVRHAEQSWINIMIDEDNEVEGVSDLKRFQVIKRLSVLAVFQDLAKEMTTTDEMLAAAVNNVVKGCLHRKMLEACKAINAMIDGLREEYLRFHLHLFICLWRTKKEVLRQYFLEGTRAVAIRLLLFSLNDDQFTADHIPEETDLLGGTMLGVLEHRLRNANPSIPIRGIGEALGYSNDYSARLFVKNPTYLAISVADQKSAEMLYITPSPSAPSVIATRATNKLSRVDAILNTPCPTLRKSSAVFHCGSYAHPVPLQLISQRPSGNFTKDDQRNPQTDVDAVLMTPCPSQGTKRRYSDTSSMKGDGDVTDIDGGITASSLSPQSLVKTANLDPVAQGQDRRRDIMSVSSPTKRQRFVDSLAQEMTRRKRLGKPVKDINLHDLKTLQPGKWVNDEVMNTYVDFMMCTLPDIANRVYGFSTFFYQSLTEDLRVGQTINYGKVKTWIKFNIFQSKYVVVPILEQRHWYFLIICRDRNNKLTIITLDSLGISHDYTAERLKEYLVAEGNTKWSLDLTTSDIRTVKGEGIPKQENFDDCGVFTLGNIRTFLQNPDGVVNGLLQGGLDFNWKLDATQVREMIIRDLKGKQGTDAAEEANPLGHGNLAGEQNEPTSITVPESLGEQQAALSNLAGDMNGTVEDDIGCRDLPLELDVSYAKTSPNSTPSAQISDFRPSPSRAHLIKNSPLIESNNDRLEAVGLGIETVLASDISEHTDSQKEVEVRFNEILATFDLDELFNVPSPLHPQLPDFNSAEPFTLSMTQFTEFDLCPQPTEPEFDLSQFFNIPQPDEPLDHSFSPSNFDMQDRNGADAFVFDDVVKSPIVYSSSD